MESAGKIKNDKLTNIKVKIFGEYLGSYDGQASLIRRDTRRMTTFFLVPLVILDITAITVLTGTMQHSSYRVNEEIHRSRSPCV